MPESKIFSRNRALGYVSNHIPLLTRYIHRRKENLIVTSVGRAFHTYGCAHFTLLSVSGQHPDDITCLSGDAYHVYTASETTIYAWRRGNELKHTYKGHSQPVHLILPFGPHIISIDEESTLKLFSIKTEEEVLSLTFSNNVFKITKIVHPNTYINKVLLGSDQGHLQLWNLKTIKMIYTFNGWNSPVTALEQAPAIDVMAIGLANGKIKMHNIKLDVTLFEVIQDWGMVTSISFRSDDNPVMATGSPQGHVVLWNLEERKVESQVLNAHYAAVAGVQCLSNEPLMVTNSSDNSLKLWIFDLADGAARLLRIREGHSEPPTFVRFYGLDGHNILSAGGDSSLRIFSTITETFNKSLGRASFNRKASKKKGRNVDDNLIMPAITEIAMEMTREKDWDNIAAAHLGLGVVTTWSYDKLKMGEHKILPTRFKKNYQANATSLFLTHCGNFLLVGYNTGHVERFNIQSGIHRMTYGGEKGAHEGPVKGIMVDPLNQEVVTAGRDGKIKFWGFQSGKGQVPKMVVTLSEPVKWLRTHRESSLIALALDDFSLILIDFETRRVVRHFRGHTGHLTDATFSPDSRWLVTASMDATIRTWDIPSAKLVDVFQVPEACTSLDFSATGDYLVTSHISNLGVYLWSNKTLFTHVSLRAITPNSSIPVITLPGSSSEQNDNIESVEVDSPEQEDDEYTSPEQLNANLITMSSLANSKWQNLLNIDVVKKRNKPKEPPKAPEAAPFFLPTIPSLDIQFDLSETPKDAENSKLLIPSDFSNLTGFGRLLKGTAESDEFSEVVSRLKKLGPSSVDFEIQSLSLDPSCSTLVMLQFMKMIKWMMESKKDFELAQAYLAVFLKIHGTKIQEEKELWRYLDELQSVQLKMWSTIRDKLYYNLSVVQHVKRM
ncbi:WD repeat-containing protein 36 [Diachasmimorpha longicaudata]|uniref:WD repeat-containing protein 36 n=1 Tax=Diachasmimorpha longicaudata TaxID=58733 RepID=UPI0030B8DE94